MNTVNANTNVTLHAAVVAVVNRAYFSNLMPAHYADVGSFCRNEPVTELSLVDALKSLAKVPSTQWGKLPGYQTKDLLNKVAVRGIRRTITSIETLIIQGQKMWDKLGRNPIGLIEADEKNFKLPADITLVMAFLDVKGTREARGIFVSPELLSELLEAADKFLGLFGHRTDVATLSRRLKAMVRPQAIRLEAGAGAPNPALADLARANADYNHTSEGK